MFTYTKSQRISMVNAKILKLSKRLVKSQKAKNIKNTTDLRFTTEHSKKWLTTQQPKKYKRIDYVNIKTYGSCKTH